jgi:uncharacterized protein
MNATSQAKIRKIKNKISELEKKASSGDFMALTRLGEIFGEGIGVKKNYKKVLETLHLGAKLKDRFSTWVLADSLYYGTYGPIDRELGIKFYKKAASLGQVPALTSIGRHCFKHANTDAEFKSAVKYYRKAAKFNEPHALFNLGLVHASGEGGRKSPKMALNYFLESYNNGNKSARLEIGKLYAEEFQDVAQAKTWLKRAAKSGNKEAISYLKKLAKK